MTTVGSTGHGLVETRAVQPGGLGVTTTAAPPAAVRVTPGGAPGRGDSGSLPTVAGPSPGTTDDDGLARGVVVGRYVVLGRLGAGGMGVVHAAYDPELDRKVALKLLRPQQHADAVDRTAGRQRLLREALALGKLAHPNVVAVHDVGVHDGDVWLALEFVEGVTFRTWLEDQPRTWPEALAVLLAAGRGLAAAHAARLLHRDFKPDNVMVSPDGRVRVMDLGLARGTGEETAEAGAGAAGSALSIEMTQAGAILGTPAYMAPEQFRGGETDTRTDVFAFCVTLWEAVYGERPFAGETWEALMANVAAGTRRPPPRGRPVPRWLRRCCERGLAVRPELRWPSMTALLDALAAGQAQARRRRWAAAAGLVAFTGAAFVGAGRYAEAQAVAACAAAGASVAEVWNAEAQAGLMAGMRSTGVTGAEVMAGKVMDLFAAQAAAIEAVQTEVCLDARVRGALDADTAARADWCLEARRIELASLLAELSRADRTAVYRAVPAASRLVEVAGCGDPRRLVALPAPPADRAGAGEVLRALWHAGALRAAGRFAAGLAAAREAQAAADRQGWPPLIAGARLQVGRLLADSGRYAEAEAELEAGYFIAANALAVYVEANAATELVGLVGLVRARHEEGLRWYRHADVALSQLEPEGEGPRRAEALAVLAELEVEAGAYEPAREHAARALAIRERLLGPDHPEVADALNTLGIVHHILSADTEALALHRRALAIRERAFGPDHPEVGASLANLVNVHRALDQPDEARALLRRVLTIRGQAFGADHPSLAEDLVTLADDRVAAGAHAEARALAERALRIEEEALGQQHPSLARPLNILAIVHLDAGERAEALACLERALAVREQALGPDHPDVAGSLDNLATLHLDAQAYAQARTLALRALAIRERALGADHPDVEGSLQLLADVLLPMDETEAAREALERLLRLQERRLGTEHAALAMVLYNLGWIAREQQRPADAVPLLERAVRIEESARTSEDWLADLRFALAEALWDAPAGGGRERARARVLAAQARERRRIVEVEPGALAEVEAFLARRPR